MKTYHVTFAEDVPHYGCAEIQAENDDAALESARAYDLSEVTLDPDHNWGTCRRIVAIEDEEGNTIAEEVPLDDCFLYSGGEKARLLCDAAPAMLEALELCSEVLSDLARLDDGTPSISALNMARAAIAKAEGGAP
jgi:hypothetical protein